MLDTAATNFYFCYYYYHLYSTTTTTKITTAQAEADSRLARAMQAGNLVDMPVLFAATGANIYRASNCTYVYIHIHT